VAQSLPPNPQRIGHPIDVIEPRSNQRDLQDALIIEAGRSQSLMVARRDLGRVLGQLHHVINHHPFDFGDRCGLIILFERLDERIIQSDPTQKLCVRDNSVMAFVGQRDHRGNHLMLPAREWQLW
jgi:hypothetical protein